MKVSFGRVSDVVTANITCILKHVTKNVRKEKFKVFSNLVDIGINNIMPERSIRVYPKDCPRMPVRLKELIRMRQQAFYSNRHGLAYKFYRNAINKKRKLCKGQYYASKVQDLKGVNPRLWWKEVNKLSDAKNRI